MDKYDEWADRIADALFDGNPREFMKGYVRQYLVTAASEATVKWHPWSEAPRDGRWIIAVCNDHETVRRVSWGRNRDGELRWCSGTASYGNGLFFGWIDCPQPSIASAIEKEPVSDETR